MSTDSRLAVIGLGYIGLPLAVALAKHFPVVGYDVNPARVAELRNGLDRNRDVAADELRLTGAHFTTDESALDGHGIFIITVPTPVDDARRPDLGAIQAACATVGRHLARGSIVVLESTVYPGVTEEFCGPILERESKLRAGADFFLGYSPERINPGDREHTIERIVKVVAGQTTEVAKTLAQVYGSINGGQVFVARDIRTAEAAKVIENAQRDINIAFINEVAVIFGRLGISIHDVLAAANTKWNFLRFTPGLVGGHCIGVDPYYLADVSRRHGYHPEVILAGRRINDNMGAYIASRIHEMLPARAQVLLLGLTFKEDVTDLRNSKVVDIVRWLRDRGHDVQVHDPLADKLEARHEYGIELLPSLDRLSVYDCVVGAVAHRDYAKMDTSRLAALLKPNGVLADIKGVWRQVRLPDGIRRWEL